MMLSSVEALDSDVYHSLGDWNWKGPERLLVLQRTRKTTSPPEQRFCLRGFGGYDDNELPFISEGSATQTVKSSCV